jgi:hypothetical protein
MDRFWEAGPELAEVRVRPWTGDEAPDALLRGLGPLGLGAGGEDVADRLAELCRRMSAAARRRALG